jgi:Nif11 domain
VRGRSRAAMSREGLDALRRRVHDDPSLALRLRGLRPEEFDTGTVRVAAELGCDVTEADLRAASAETQQRWLLRWIL